MNIFNDKNKVGNLLLLLFSIFYLVNISSIADDPTQLASFFTAKTMPWVLGIISTAICVLKLALPSDNGQGIKESVVNFQWKLMLLLLLLMFAYSLLFSWLGFFVATTLFLFVGFIILEERRYFLSASIALFISGFMWLILSFGFDLQLDNGEIFYMLMGETS